MAQDHLLLENQVCFRVYSLEKAIMAAYKPLLGGLGLTYPQYLVMLVLWERGESTIGLLCELLGLDTGTVSPLIKRMEKADLVTRQRLPSDERTVMVRLTPDGMSLRERAQHVPQAIVSCMVPAAGSFDGESLSRLRQSLDEALRALRGNPSRTDDSIFH